MEMYFKKVYTLEGERMQREGKGREEEMVVYFYMIHWNKIKQCIRGNNPARPRLPFLKQHDDRTVF